MMPTRMKKQSFLSLLIFLLSIAIGKTQESPLHQLTERKVTLSAEEIKNLDTLNTNYQVSSSFSPGKKIVPHKKKDSVSMAKIIHHKLPKDSLYFVLCEQEYIPLKNNTLGRALYLINTHKENMSFSTIGGSFDIITEALNPKGEWARISSNPYEGWCGSGIYSARGQVSLLAQDYWSFEVPVLKGTFKTKIRYMIYHMGKVIYSNEIAASINQEQFKSYRERLHQKFEHDPWQY